MPFQAAPPRSVLGRHRQLSPTAALKVSPLCLGAMSFGENNASDLGICDKPTSFAILDRFVALGGNFIDTANSYQHEQSEVWLGEWMKERGIRDQIVLASKYGFPYKGYLGDEVLHSNYGGMNAKSLRVSVEDSLRKLQVDYLDILYVHWWDYATSVEELMTSLNDLVKAGKVLYLGISDSPAWCVAMANQYAKDHGLRQFSVYQGLWNAGTRDLERDVLPMAQFQGMAVVPWGPVGSGRFQTEEVFKEREKDNPGRKTNPVSDADRKVSKVLEGVAGAHGATIHSAALAYLLNKAPYVFPIIGCRKMEHLESNINALTISLSPEEMNQIDNASNYNAGFPHTFLKDIMDNPTEGATCDKDVWANKTLGMIDWVERPQAIKPMEKR